MTTRETIFDALAIIVHAAWWGAIIIGMLAAASWIEYSAVNTILHILGY